MIRRGLAGDGVDRLDDVTDPPPLTARWRAPSWSAPGRRPRWRCARTPEPAGWSPWPRRPRERRRSRQRAL